MNPLLELQNRKQAVWLDYIRRDLIRGFDDDETGLARTVKRWPISQKTRICVIEPINRPWESESQKTLMEVSDAEDGRRTF